MFERQGLLLPLFTVMIFICLQDDLSSTVIQQLESRLKELCHENRELRDFASQLSSRMFQFSDFLEHNCDLCMQDNANISFDCQDEHHSLGESHVAEHDISEVQSFDEKRNLFKKSIDKQSTPVIDFSFELPFRVIRDDLIKRVQYASWVVWSKLKCLARCHTNSVKETPGFKSQFCHTESIILTQYYDGNNNNDNSYAFSTYG
ncbi:unnamed protein product [Trichobilharzia regenti]|nr:unnamed protein product [Trichobilharzia regenti]